MALTNPSHSSRTSCSTTILRTTEAVNKTISGKRTTRVVKLPAPMSLESVSPTALALQRTSLRQSHQPKTPTWLHSWRSRTSSVHSSSIGSRKCSSTVTRRSLRPSPSSRSLKTPRTSPTPSNGSIRKHLETDELSKHHLASPYKSNHEFGFYI